MEAWRQTMRAMRVEEEAADEDRQTTERAAHGWTMASALIRYKLREQRRAEERRAAHADTKRRVRRVSVCVSTLTA